MDKKLDGFGSREWMGCLFLLVLWQILLWAQNPSLMSDDSGEMIAASYRLGITHPPGYPLFCLLGRLFSFVPLGTIAFRFNLLSSLFVLFSFFFIGLTCFEFLKTQTENRMPHRIGWASVFLALLFIFSCRGVFAQALTAKGCVYTLTLFFLSVFLWLRIKTHEKGLTFSKVLWVCFLWSVGLSNHWESEVFWIPFLAYWFYQEKTTWSLKRCFHLLSVVMIGLSVYLYLPLRSALGALPSWGDPKLWSGFIWVVSRKPFWGTEPFLKSMSDYLSLWKGYLNVQLFYWIPGFVILALIGLFYLWKNSRKLFYATLIFYLPVVLAIILVSSANFKFLMTVYLVSTQGLVAFWGFIGIFVILRESYKKSLKGAILAFFLLLIAGFFWTGHVFEKENKSQYYLATDFAINALKLLPSQSIFLTEGDNYVIPLCYEKWVEGLRPDVVWEPSIFLFHNWGWNQLAEQDHSVASALESSNTLQGRLKALTGIGNKRSLFYTLDQTYLRSNLDRIGGDWIPWALEERWFPRKIEASSVCLLGLKLALVERLRGVMNPYSRAEVTTFEIHRYYANQFFSTGSWLREKGDGSDALRYFDLGIPFDPQAPYAYCDMAEILGERGYFELSRRLCLLGIKADPGYFANYSNLANVYFLQGKDFGAKECLDLAQQRIGDSLLVENALRSLAQRSQSKNRPKVKEKSVSQYKALGDWFENQQMFFLGSLVKQVGGEPWVSGS